MVGLVDDGTDDTVQQNVYDARTFRVTRFDYTEGELSETRHFYTSEWQSIEDRLGSSPNGEVPERQQVWGERYVDDLVLRDRDANHNGSLDERLYGLQDANWNVVAMADTSPDVQERYAYSLFGWPTFLSGTMNLRFASDFASEILFTGQRFNSASRLHLFRNRWFTSLLGTFLTRDPLDYPDGPNIYAGWFVPHTVDPSGMAIPCAGAGKCPPWRKQSINKRACTKTSETPIGSPTFVWTYPLSGAGDIQAPTLSLACWMEQPVEVCYQCCVPACLTAINNPCKSLLRRVVYFEKPIDYAAFNLQNSASASLVPKEISAIINAASFLADEYNLPNPFAKIPTEVRVRLFATSNDELKAKGECTAAFSPPQWPSGGVTIYGPFAPESYYC